MQNYTALMRHVFLSYSRRNSELAFRIYNRVQSMGVPVWMDQQSIRPGAGYAEEIYLAINGASAVVLLLSAASNESKEIHKEIQLAAAGNVPVIPLRLESVAYHPALGYHLAALQWIDATSDLDAALSTLLDQLQRLQPALPPRPSEPASSPAPVVIQTDAPETFSMPVDSPASAPSLQQRLAAAVLARYPDGVVKKIDQDNYLDIFIPSVCPRAATNLTVKTLRGVIRSFFYCRSAAFVDRVLGSATTVERWHWGLIPIGNPAFTNPDDAIRTTLDMLADIAVAGGEARSASVAVTTVAEQI